MFCRGVGNIKTYMASHAPAQNPDIEDATTAEVDAIRSGGKRSTTQKLDLSDPRVINKEVVVALARAISPDMIAAKIRELLDMTRTTKAGEVPDVRAMEAGIKLWLAYTAGLPTQRQEIVSVALDADSSLGMRERLAHSPALRQVLRGVLDDVEQNSSQNNGSPG